MQRNRWLPQIALTGVTVVFGGCASPFDDAHYSSREMIWLDETPTRWQVAEGGAVHTRATLRSDEGGSEGVGRRLTADAGLDDYLELALRYNPSILAAARRVERLGARPAQVTSLDDPMFQVAPVGEMAETAAGQVGLVAGVSQKLPFPGKLDTRGKIAEQDVAVALAELREARLRVAADTRRAYWSYYFATRALEVTRNSRALLEQFHAAARAQYAAGDRSQADVLRASVELSNLDNELITLAQRQATARGMLNQLMDRPVDATLPEPPPADARRMDETLDELLRAAARRSPALQKVHERIEQARLRRELARLGRWPDLTVSLSYAAVDDEGLAMSATGEDQWWLGFGINLPVWSGKYDAAEREALQGLFEGVADLTAQRNRVAFEVQEAYLQADAQQRLVALFEEVIVPQARQTVEASSSGYRAGAVDFLTLVDNWRKLLSFELMAHRALMEMEQAAADLERAVGGVVRRDEAAGETPGPAERTQAAPGAGAEVE